MLMINIALLALAGFVLQRKLVSAGELAGKMDPVMNVFTGAT